MTTFHHLIYAYLFIVLDVRYPLVVGRVQIYINQIYTNIHFYLQLPPKGVESNLHTKQSHAAYMGVFFIPW